MQTSKILGSIFLAIALQVSPCLRCIASAQVQSAQNRFTISDEDASGPGSPRVIVLRDNVAGLEAAIAPSEGGELSSYRVKFKGQWIELLYHARDYSPGPGFKGKAPLLWPAIGQQFLLGTSPKSSCNDEGFYQLDGKTYSMPCHGFARSLPWKEIRKSANNNGASVTLELRDSDRTRPLYPFAFQLDATYELADGLLTINYTVVSGHSNTRPMIFSIGNHIAFNLPLINGTDPAAMTLETPSTTQLLRDSHGVINGQLAPRSFDVPTRLEDFDSTTAIPLAGYKNRPFAILSGPQGLSVRISQQASTTLPEPLVRFALYGGPKTGYLSIEPWFGVQNSLNTHQGLVKLAPGQSWTWQVEVKADIPPQNLAPQHQ